MLSERLRAFIGYLELTPYAFEMSIGVSKGSISKAIDNGKTIGSESLGKIFTTYPNLNLEWLIIGEGDMLKNINIPIQQKDDVHLIHTPNSTPNSKSEKLGVRNEWKASSPRESKYSEGGIEINANQVAIDILDVRAAANFTGVALAGDKPEILGQLTLPKKMLQSGKHMAFPIIGDSMEPTLYAGDTVVGRFLDRSEYENIRDQFIYIVVTRDGVIVKRVLNRLKERGWIRCRSDNRKYSAYNVDEDDIVNIFEAKAKLSFNFTNEQANLFDLMHELEERLESVEEKLQTKKK
jgi:phage repressor protein C with HTH and peptisase S24 domain